jgi:hypothetical protein
LGPLEVGETTLVPVTFEPPLVLEPEGTYVIEGPALKDSILTWMGAEGDPYPGGTAFNCAGEVVSPVDFNFITFTPSDAAAPETTISGGPAAGTSSTETVVEISFSGTDDLSYASKLRFACSLDSGPAGACASPYASSALGDGRHTFSVQALDEAGRMDASPATVRWTVDTTPPDKPTVRGPRKTRKKRAKYVFAAGDNIDNGAELRFVCSLDAPRQRPCGHSFDAVLRPGAHLLRVAAVDRAGNRGRVAVVRVVRLGA